MSETGSWKFLIQPRVVRIAPNKFFVITRDLFDKIDKYTIGSEIPSQITYIEKSSEYKEMHDWYHILIHEDYIEISAESLQSFYIGLSIIKQLLSFSSSNHLHCGEIEDWADIEKRGVMLDVSRDRVYTIETLKSLIDFYSLLRFNQLILYIEHTFAYEGHEAVYKDASPYTPLDIFNLDVYSKERGIELIINQNSFGHMERFLAHKEYHYLAENPDGYADPWGVYRPIDTTVSPVQEGVIPFFTDLYTQLSKVISTDYIHVGGDEPWGFGSGKSKATCNKKGLEYVYLDYIKDLYTVVTSLGKKMMIWADVVLKYPHIIPLIPKDIVICQWEYEAHIPIKDGCKALHDAEKKFYIGCGTSTWNSLSGRWNNAYNNIISGIKNAHIYQAKGLLITEWGDNGHIQQHVLQIPPIILSGILSWNRNLENTFDMSALISTILEFVPSLVSSFTKLSQEEYNTLSYVLLSVEGVGEIYETEIHNNTLLGAILLYHQGPYYRQSVIDARGYTFEREKYVLHTLLETLDVKLFHADSIMKDELTFTIELLFFLCDYGAALLSTEHIKIGEIPHLKRDNLASTLSKLLARYSMLWLLTSRPGGLKDSAARLQSLVEILQEKK